MVTRGAPWYVSYKFRPYDKVNEKPSERLIKSLKENNHILNKLKTYDLDILKILHEASKKEKSIDININEIKRLMKKYPLMRQFIIRLTKNMEKYCCIINYILLEMFDPKTKLGLTDFYGKSFYLDI